MEAQGAVLVGKPAREPFGAASRPRTGLEDAKARVLESEDLQVRHCSFIGANKNTTLIVPR